MILVDPRAGSGKYLDLLKSRTNGQARMAKPMLDSGDFMFEGTGPEGVVSIGVEVKELGDMLGSMRSGRYLDQMRRMKADYDYCYLMIRGSYAPGVEGYINTPTRGGWGILNLSTREQRDRGRGSAPFSYSELDKFICSLEIVENIIVRKASTELDVVQQIADLCSWWQKDFESHSSTKSVKLQPEGMLYRRASVLRMVAAQLPTIGWEVSRHVEKHFKSVHRMITALPTEWRSVTWKSKKSGRNMSIGEKDSVRIYGAIHEGDSQAQDALNKCGRDTWKSE